jgi:hypothetical protein
MSNHERQMSASGKERVASAVPQFRAPHSIECGVLFFCFKEVAEGIGLKALL